MSQSRVHRLALQRQHGEDRLLDAPERLTRGAGALPQGSDQRDDSTRGASARGSATRGATAHLEHRQCHVVSRIYASPGE
jgi:hypothetical protein